MILSVSRVLVLLSPSGADLEALDNDSYTPLLTAAANGQTDAFRTLLGRGATIDVVDKEGRSAVFLAAEEEHIPILKVGGLVPILDS